jgi:hypothetical protein
VLAALLLLGVAVVAAQNDGPNPNENADAAAQQGDEAANPLAASEMAGQSPNDVGLAAAAPAGAQNDRPVEEMVGQSPNGDDSGQEGAAAPDSAAAVAAAGGTRFLITSANYTGAQADTSCPAGYHMASLYELHDVTNLTYANGPGAKIRGDQGSGPVAGWWGWVRTGVDSFVANEAGRANCAVWTSTTAGEYGTLVRLAETWTSGAAAISPWQAQTWSCTGIAPVWCVAN